MTILEEDVGYRRMWSTIVPDDHDVAGDPRWGTGMYYHDEFDSDEQLWDELLAAMDHTAGRRWTFVFSNMAVSR